MDLGKKVVQGLTGRLEAPLGAAISQINKNLKEIVDSKIKDIEDEKMRITEWKQILRDAISNGKKFLENLQPQGAAQYPVEIIAAERQGMWLEVTVCNFESWPFSNVLAKETLEGADYWVENVRVEPGLAVLWIALLMQPAGDSTMDLQLSSARGRPPVPISDVFSVTLTAEPASLPSELPSWPAQ